MSIKVPGAMQSHSDITKWQNSRLADGIQSSIIEIQQALDSLKFLIDHPPTITNGSIYAIVEVKNLDNDLRAKYFILPAGGGNTYEVDGKEITILGIGALMARVLIGAVVGNEVEIEIRETMKRFSVISVT